MHFNYAVYSCVGMAVGFVAVWIVSAIRRSGNKQLKVLLQKYLFTGFADKIFAGEIRPSRVKILKDKMIVYCKVYMIRI